MSVRFTVGELAQLSHVSKQTLIFYDKEGVFRPRIVDETNGYRYYTADQLEVLDSILILKEMGFSLKEICHFMKNRTQEDAVDMLKTQQRKIADRLAALRLIEKRLALKIETLETFYAGGQAMEWLHHTKPQYLAVQTVAPPGGLLQVDIAIKKLFCKAQQYRYAHFYQIGTMIRAANLNRGRFLCAEYSFFPLEQRPQEGDFFVKPGGRYLRAYHTGKYEDIAGTYTRMLEEIRNNGCVPDGYSYEYCVLDSLTTKASAEYVTEIQIHVRKDATT